MRGPTAIGNLVGRALAVSSEERLRAFRGELFGKFGTRTFRVNDATKPEIFRRSQSQQKEYFIGVAKDCARLADEGMLIRVPQEGSKYPAYRIPTPADAARQREA